MRLFLALWPGARERRTLASLAAACHAPWQPVPTEGLHLTAAFLGDVPRARLPWLAAVLARQRADAPPIVLDRLEAWGEGRWRCAVGEATPSLRAWQGRLAAMLAAGGLRIERRAFVPHVTLAKRMGPGHGHGRGAAGAGEAPQPIRLPLRLAGAGRMRARLVLVESLGPGRRYRVLLGAGRPGSPSPGQLAQKEPLFGLAPAKICINIQYTQPP